MKVAVNPVRVAAVVKHTVNTSLAVLNVVVDRIRESARQCAIETEPLVVYSGVKGILAGTDPTIFEFLLVSTAGSDPIGVNRFGSKERGVIRMP